MVSSPNPSARTPWLVMNLTKLGSKAILATIGTTTKNLTPDSFQVGPDHVFDQQALGIGGLGQASIEILAVLFGLYPRLASPNEYPCISSGSLLRCS